MMNQILLRLVMVGLVWSVCLGILATTGPLTMFWDALSMIMVLVLSGLITLGRHASELLQSEVRLSVSSVSKTLGVAAMLSGVFGFAVGAITVFAQADSQHLIGPGLAVAALSLLYGGMVAMAAMIAGGVQG